MWNCEAWIRATLLLASHANCVAAHRVHRNTPSFGLGKEVGRLSNSIQRLVLSLTADLQLNWTGRGLRENHSGQRSICVLNETLEITDCVSSDALSEPAFPHNGDLPAHFDQSYFVAPIPSDICLELRLPEIGTCRRSTRILATGMTMPETAVHKNGRSPFR